MDKTLRRGLRSYGGSLRRTVSALNGLAQTAISTVTLVASGLAWWRFGVGWGLLVLVSLACVVAVVNGFELRRELDSEDSPQNPTIVYNIEGVVQGGTGGAGGAGMIGGAGGSAGSVAFGPGSYASGGAATGGVSLLEVLASHAIHVPIPLAEFIRRSGYDPEGIEVRQIFGWGAAGGGAGESGGESERHGAGGLVVISTHGEGDAPPVDVQVFATPGTAVWVKPLNPGYKTVVVSCVGAGGGGGAGHVSNIDDLPSEMPPGVPSE